MADDINPKWVENLEKKIDAIPDCDELYKLMDKLIDKLMKAMQQSKEDADELEPLTEPPSDLDGVIKWITGAIKKIKKAYDGALAKLAALTIIYTRLMAKIVEKAEKLGCIAPPPPPPPPVP